MNDIRAPQIKAARALLEWSQEDLAANANLSITTIRTMELGFIPKDATVEKVCKTIQDAGLVLTEGDGVRRRPDNIRAFTGADSCDKFFAEVANIASDYNGDVLVLILSEELWLQPSGPTYQSNLQRLEGLRGVAGVKCLLSNSIKSLPPSSLQLQYLPDNVQVVCPSCAMIYGNRYSTIWQRGRMDFGIAEFDIPTVALDYRKDFLSLWEKASSLKPKPSQSKPKKRD